MEVKNSSNKYRKFTDKILKNIIPDCDQSVWINIAIWNLLYFLNSVFRDEILVSHLRILVHFFKGEVVIVKYSRLCPEIEWMVIFKIIISVRVSNIKALSSHFVSLVLVQSPVDFGRQVKHQRVQDCCPQQLSYPRSSHLWEMVHLGPETWHPFHNTGGISAEKIQLPIAARVSVRMWWQKWEERSFAEHFWFQPS